MLNYLEESAGFKGMTQLRVACIVFGIVQNLVDRLHKVLKILYEHYVLTNMQFLAGEKMKNPLDFSLTQS